jgi:hypothetical protein
VPASRLHRSTCFCTVVDLVIPASLVCGALAFFSTQSSDLMRVDHVWYLRRTLDAAPFFLSVARKLHILGVAFDIAFGCPHLKMTAVIDPALPGFRRAWTREENC